MFLAACIVAYLIYKTWVEGRLDYTYAQQGRVSPRLQAKYDSGAEQKTSRYGLVDYLADAWSDNWRDRTEARRAAAQAAAGVEPSKPGRSGPSWRDRLRAVKAAAVKAAHRVVDPVEPWPQPATRPEPTPEPPVVAADVNEQRTCPVCGQAMVLDDGRWRHTTPPGDHPDVYPLTQRSPVANADNARPAPADARILPSVGDASAGAEARHRIVGPPPDVVFAGAPDRSAHPSVTCPSCGASYTYAHACKRRPSQEDPMTAPTGEAVNYETTIAQLDALIAYLQKWLDALTAALAKLEAAKNDVTDAQDGYKQAAKAAASIQEHLAALHLDAHTLGLISAIAEAMPASAVDEVLALLEEAEVKLRSLRDNAATALEAAEAAKAHVVAQYSAAHETVQGNLGGDSRFVGSGATT
jgi:hypothetical protein